MKVHDFGGMTDVLNGQAPTWLVDSFTLINGLIAVCYALLAFFFAKRVKFPNRQNRHPLVLLASVGAMLFFVGCAHTHMELMLWSADGSLAKHWYSWWTVLSHLLQGLGGLTFWVLATFYLQLNIYDKRHYRRVVKPPE